MSNLFSVSQNLMDGWKRISMSAYNPAISGGTTPESISPIGGLAALKTSAGQLEVLSNDAADTVLGIGARSVLITGLDSTYTEITEVVALNDGVATPTVKSFLRINMLSVATAGSNGVNVGTITCRDIGGGTVREIIEPGIGVDRSMIFTVPKETQLLINTFAMSVVASSAGNISARVETWFRTSTGLITQPHVFGLASQAGPYYHQVMPPFPVPAKTDCDFRVMDITGTNNGVSAGWAGCTVVVPCINSPRY